MAAALGAFVLAAPDPARLAAFYRDLLGWVTVEDDASSVRPRDPDGHPFCVFTTA